MSEKNWLGVYYGCVNTRNTGDHGLFLLFIKLLNKYIRKKYPGVEITEENNYGQNELEHKVKNCNFGVVGGGTIINEGECSYTNWLKDFGENSCLFFGTGISDTPNNDNYLGLHNKFTPTPIISINFENMKNFKGNIYGGYRGKLDINIRNKYNGEPRPEKYIGDPWLIFPQYFSEKIDLKMEKFISKCKGENKKIIGINFAGFVHEHTLYLDREKTYKEQRDTSLGFLMKFLEKILEEGYACIAFETGSNDNNMIKHQHPFLYKTYDMDPGNILYIMRNIDYCVATRLHSIISAVACKIPVLPLCYKYKINNFLETQNLQEYSLPFLYPKNIHKKFREIIDSSDILVKIYDKYIQYTQKNIDEHMTKFLDDFLPQKLDKKNIKIHYQENTDNRYPCAHRFIKITNF